MSWSFAESNLVRNLVTLKLVRNLFWTCLGTFLWTCTKRILSSLVLSSFVLLYQESSEFWSSWNESWDLSYFDLFNSLSRISKCPNCESLIHQNHSFHHILLLLKFLLDGVSKEQYTSLWLDCSIIEVLDKSENLSF